MLDLSDHAQAAVANCADAVSLLPTIGVPEPGTLVQHWRGSLFRVTGACAHHESNELSVLYRAVDPSEPALRSCPAVAFFGTVDSCSPRFTRLRAPDPMKLRGYIPAEILSDASLEQILSSYDEPWRYFHNRDHIYGIFELAARRKIKLSIEQALAVLFHDIVYVPGAAEGVNERQSVALAQAFKSHVRAELDWAQLGRIITDTATHKGSQPESMVVLDLDLASLGDDEVHFAAANELVWLESRHLLPTLDARKDFDTRRLRFLLALVEKGPLFSTSFSDYESSARENLERLRQLWVQQYG